jgi:hypothetical protein
MFRRFSGGAREAAWPLDKVVAALEAQYGSIRLLGEDGPLSAYGVQHNGVNFIVALRETVEGSGKLAELGFLARFVGFPVSEPMVEALNRNLHISFASLEASGELFLMAGLEVVGGFDHGQLALMLESWKRDLMMTLSRISGDGMSMADAFPAARLEAAREFALNAAPAPVDGKPVDMLASFLGAGAKRSVCGDCGGRGKRGFIARLCDACDGAGFVNAR